MAPPGPLRVQNHCSTANTLRFNIPLMEAHVDQPLEIELGQKVTTLQIKVSFSPYWDGLGPVPEDKEKITLNVYASAEPLRHPCDAHYLESVSYDSLPAAPAPPPPKQQGDSATGTDSLASTISSMGSSAPKPSVSANSPAARTSDVILAFSNVRDMFYLYVFSSLKATNVVVHCLIGHAVTEFDALEHPWRISRMYNVDYKVYDDVLEWLDRFKTKLKLKTYRLLNMETGENPLHVLLDAVGDPKLAMLYIKHCARFIDPDLQDNEGQSPLFKLLRRKDIYDPKCTKYYRAIALVEILVLQAAVSTDYQDNEGNTLIHYICRSHRVDSKILQILVNAGATPNIKNNAGRTPLDEARLEEYGLLPIDIQDVEKWTSKRVFERPLRTIMVLDQIPPPHRRVVDNGPVSVPELIEKGPDGLPKRSAERGVMFTSTGFAKRGGSANSTADGGNSNQQTANAMDLHGSSERRLSNSSHLYSGAGQNQNKSTAIVAEDKMREEWNKIDRDRLGYVTIAEARGLYKKFEQFGVQHTAAEIDDFLAAPSGKVTYDEFCVFLLKLNAR